MPFALDTLQGAAELAESLLPPLGNRWLHTQAVAARAAEASEALPENERDLLVAAAWLHDIGYAPKLRDTGFRPFDGARHLASLGAPDRLVRLVAHHSARCTKQSNAGSRLSWPCTSGKTAPVLEALIFADMTTGPAGQRFDFDRRIDEILVRYEPSSEVHHAISKARPYLGAAIERTLARLGDQPM